MIHPTAKLYIFATTLQKIYLSLLYYKAAKKCFLLLTPPVL